jgi:hypothetical protein
VIAPGGGLAGPLSTDAFPHTCPPGIATGPVGVGAGVGLGVGSGVGVGSVVGVGWSVGVGPAVAVGLDDEVVGSGVGLVWLAEGDGCGLGPGWPFPVPEDTGLQPAASATVHAAAAIGSRTRLLPGARWPASVRQENHSAIIPPIPPSDIPALAMTAETKLSIPKESGAHMCSACA